jgi:hypothetical protein
MSCNRCEGDELPDITGIQKCRAEEAHSQR